ncbi:MAG: VanW family protein [Bacteroidota bacterium]|nr:VanW family protein [Bacteroidota bacterium]
MDTELNGLDPNLQKKYFKFFKSTRKNIIAASLIGFIVVMVIASAILFSSILSQKTIYKGIYINNTYVGNKTVKQAKIILTEKFQANIPKRTIKLKCKDTSESFKISDINATYEISAAVDKAYSIGRKGNVLSKLADIFDSSFNKKRFNISVSYDKKKVDDIIDSVYDKTLVTVAGPKMYFSDQSARICSGHHGENMDKNYAANKLKKMILNCEGGTIEVPVVKAPPQQIDVEQIFKKISVPEKDAALTVQNNKVTITPEVTGRTIDKSKLAEIVSELNKKEDTESVLPVSYVYPKVTVESLNKSLFKDTLYTYSTLFNQSTQNNRNRVVNMRLAVSKVNNTILAPGQVFSFNNTVGDRTAALGYKTAITYSSGKLVEGIGGGLCQVSTTLYNAVLRSDLKVISRLNHSFIVTYVPLGMDATVSYGSVDFKFMNSTKWPIKINCWTTNSRIFFSLTGTNENPKKTVEVSSKIIKTTPYKTIYIDDPTLPAGKVNPVPRQPGHTGYVVDTYKIVKIDGKVISSGKIYSSYYKMLNEELLRGTKKAAGATPAAKPTTPATTPTVKPITKPTTKPATQPATKPAEKPVTPPKTNNAPTVVQGVDDADNPPATDIPQPQTPSAPVSQ